jgi:imidazole glycerol-phosphate synthase subunit HisH
MNIAVVKYNSGNVRSVANALERLGANAVLTDDPNELRSADKVIFPGVGEASSAMAYLTEKGLDPVIRSLKQPVLAICLGMQLFMTRSEENNTGCLDVIPGVARRFSVEGLKVPQMGWNTISNLSSTLFHGIAEGSRVYFVHSYFVGVSDETAAVTNYGIDFSSAIARANFYGVQFHPEKSGPVGAKILKNFLEL